MSKNDKNSHENTNVHTTGCGCKPPVMSHIIELAGLELSRRDYVKGVSLVSGIIAAGSLGSAVLANAGAITGGAGADTIYTGGPILTMVKDGRILAIGTESAVMATKAANTNVVDLGGKCLMPGFFDPHSHTVMQSVKFSTANLDPRPIGKAGSIADIQRILREWIDQKNIKPGQ